MSEYVRASRGTTARIVLDVITTLAALTAAVVLVWMMVVRSRTSQPPKPPLPTTPISLQGAATLGLSTAPVIVMEFSDFQCPFCARFVQEVLPALRAKYVDSGQVQVAFRHLPLPIHARAERAAEAATCGGAQQKFWPVHDRLFAAGGKLEEADLVQYASAAGVEPAQFATCMAGDAAGQVKRDSELAKTLKLSGTPSFLIGRRTADGQVEAVEILVGAQPLKDFERAFEKALKRG